MNEVLATLFDSTYKFLMILFCSLILVLLNCSQTEQGKPRSKLSYEMEYVTFCVLAPYILGFITSNIKDARET